VGFLLVKIMQKQTQKSQLISTVEEIMATVNEPKIVRKKRYLDEAIKLYRQQIDDWSAVIEGLSNDYDAPHYALEYAFAYWLLELVEKIKEEPGWFVRNFEPKEFEETLAEFTPEPDPLDNDGWSEY
jgi:hypothetical protein